MATRSYEVDAVHSLLPIDINGGFEVFGVSCAQHIFSENGLRLSEKILKSVVLKRLHHIEFVRLLIGL